MNTEASHRSIDPLRNPNDTIIHAPEEVDIQTFALPPSPRARSAPNLIETKNSSRRKKIFLITSVVAVIVIITVVLAVVLTQKNPVQDLEPTSDVIFTRTFRQGAQDVYRVEFQGEMSLTPNATDSTKATKHYTLQATTQEVTKETIILNFILMPGDTPLTLDSSSFLDSSPDNSQSSDLGKVAEKINLSYVTCKILMTGKINYCLKPNYLSWNDFQFMLGLIDQLSPILEKKYFEKNRILQESDQQDYVEGREFAFSNDANSNAVALANNYQNNQFGNGDGDNKFSMGIETAMDAKTGQILNSKQNNQLAMKAADTNENEIVRNANLNYNIELNLKTSGDADAKFLEFIAQLNSVPGLFTSITNPLVNKEVVSSAGVSTELSSTTSNTSLTDANGNPLPGSRLLVSNKAVDVLVARYNLFNKTILGADVIGYAALNCTDEDKCKFQILANTFNLDVPLYTKDFNLTISKLAKIYKYIRVKIVKRVKNISDLLVRDLALIQKLSDDIGTQVSIIVPTLCDPIQSTMNTLSRSVIDLNSEFSKIKAAQSPISKISSDVLSSLILQLEVYSSSSITDMFYVVQSLNGKYLKLQGLLESKYIDHSTKTAIISFSDTLQNKLHNYYIDRRTRLSSTHDILLSTLNGLTQTIEPSWLGFPSDGLLQLFGNITGGIKLNFKNLTTQILNEFDLCKEDTIILLDMEYMTLLDDLRQIQSNFKTLLDNRTTTVPASLDQSFLLSLQQDYATEELNGIFLTSRFDIEMAKEFNNTLRNAFIKVAQDVHTSLKKFASYSNDVFYNQVTATLQSSIPDIIGKFATAGTNISQALHSTIQELLSDFKQIYEEALSMTESGYDPNEDEPVNLLEIVDDFNEAFAIVSNVKKAYDGFKSLTLPTKAFTDAKNRLTTLTQSLSTLR